MHDVGTARSSQPYPSQLLRLPAEPQRPGYNLQTPISQNLPIAECMQEYAAANPPPSKPPPDNSAPLRNKIDKALIMQMDEDFMSLMADDPNRDPVAAY